MKNIAIIIGGILLVCALGAFAIFKSNNGAEDTQNNNLPEQNEETNNQQENSTSTESAEGNADTTEAVIGTSVENRDIKVHHYGTGEKKLVFVGGIHGGYGWNTSLLAYELIEYLEENPDAIPDSVSISVIPVLNPDGLASVVGTSDRFEIDDAPTDVEDTISGRFNAHDVDLNRNFNCEWKPTGTWQSRTVSGGAEAFSEPESKAFRDFIEDQKPTAVVVWYSAAGGVFASSCGGGVEEETKTLTNIYADASGYKAHQTFDFYELNGDMVNWLAKEGIPAISVLLETHDSVEWDENKAGIGAIIMHYAGDSEEDEEDSEDESDE